MIIKGGTIISCAGSELTNGYIEIKKDKILKVGTEYNYSNKEEIIDAEGCLILPGFIDAHTHIGMWEDSMGFEGDDGNEDTDPCTPHLRAIDAVNPLDFAFIEAVDAGVTTVITGPGSSNPIGGQLAAIKTVGCRIDEMIVNPSIGVKFALGENPKTSFHARNQTPVTRMATAALIREQLQKAKRYLEDCKKAENDDELDPPEFDAKCEALIPLLTGKSKAHFHAHRADDIFTAVRIAEEFNLDLVLIHCTEGHMIADKLSELGCKAICGPLLGSRTKPELKNYTQACPARLIDAGVLTAICTDHPELPLQYLALSAAVAGAEGIDKTEMIKSITINAAKICGIDNRVGSLEPGKDADILIFDKDPFAVGAKPKIVISNGKIVRGSMQKN